MKTIIMMIASCLILATAIAQKATTIKQLNGASVKTAFIQKRLSQLIKNELITGLQVAVINDNKIVWINSFGLKDVEHHMNINDSTEMYGASFTKSIMAYLFLRMCDNGVFKLDKPIYQYLHKKIAEYPKWAGLAGDTVAFNKITPRMIFSHTSGMPILRSMYGDKLNLIAQPGKKFYYSNEGMNFIGFMMEEYTGRLLDNLATEYIFKPLKMPHTSMVWQSEYLKNYSMAYKKDGTLYGSERKMQSKGAGSLTTTASDYARFVIALQTGYGLSKASYHEMMAPQIMITSKKGFGPERDSLTNDNKKIGLAWGLGVGLFNSPYGKAFFHAGHGEANQNYYVAYPSKKIAIVMLSNSENFERSGPQLLNFIIGDVSSPLKWMGYLDN